MSGENLNWQLEKYFYTSCKDPDIDKSINEAKKLVEEFKDNYKGRISELDTQGWLDFFQKDSQISYCIVKPLVYLELLTAQDTQNQEALKKIGEISLLLIDLQNQLLFVSQEIKALGYKQTVALSQQKELQEYKNYFYQRALSAKYLLEEKTEYALNLKSSSGISSGRRIYEELTNSFQFELEINGKKKNLTEMEVRALRMDKKAENRKKAYFALQEKYKQRANQIVLGNIYNQVLKDWTSEIKLRGYKNVLSPRNESEEMPDKAIDLLFSTVTGKFNLYQRYLRNKATAMGVNGKLEPWDTLAPISEDESDYSFREAWDLFLESAQSFNPDFAKYAQEMLGSGQIDALPKKGKRGGAFSLSVKGLPGFVLLNHTSKLRDVATIAHELGHAYHGKISQKQPEQVYNPVLCLAETASVFSEMVLAEKLSQKITDPKQKLNFLDQRLSDIFATIFRQIMYENFEKRVHELAFEGKDLAYTDFNTIWSEENDKLCGNQVKKVIPDKDLATWSSIPHIFERPFYCYSYAFGNLLTFALFNRYKEEGRGFIEKYNQILSSGGSEEPYSLLLKYDLDITKPDFYLGGLKVVEKILEEYENLVTQINS